VGKIRGKQSAFAAGRCAEVKNFLNDCFVKDKFVLEYATKTCCLLPAHNNRPHATKGLK